MRIALLASSAIVAALAIGPATANESATEASTRALIDGLEERQMPDVMLWVVERAEKNPATSPALKAELPFLKGTALVGASRTESNPEKRAAMLDEAEKAIDAFLGTKPAGSLAIAAYSQKANLLIERGRGKVEQAKRPGQDPNKLGPEAVAFFDSALKTLKSTLPADHKGEIGDVTNAEDAVRKELRRVDADIAKVKEEATAKAKKDEPPRLTPAQKSQMEKLEAAQESLRGKLLSTRLMTAGVYFEKAKAYPAGSQEANAALVESTNLFKALSEKYANKGAGMFARYYWGRNEVMLGKHEAAIETLAPVVVIDGRSPLAIGLKAKAVNTTLEACLALAAAEKDATKQTAIYAKFDDDLRKFALTPAERLPGRRLDAEWLALKYRAATMLERKGESLDTKEKSLKTALLRDAKKLATEVATVNKDFAKEARDLAAKLGKDLPAGSEEKDFATLFADAKVSFAAMQEKQARARQLQSEGKAAEAAEAIQQSAPDRDAAIKLLEQALALPSGEETDDAALNSARYMLTFLLYDAKRFAEAGALGTLLAEKYPNALGSRQASKVALASLQSLTQQQDAAVAKSAKEKLLALAAVIAKTWPAEPEGGDALTVILNAGIEARSGDQLVAVIEKVPAESPRRAELLVRAGTALRREVQDAQKSGAAGKTPAETIARWNALAKSSLDEGLTMMEAATLPAGTGAKIAVSAALTRAQMALADDDLATAERLLTHKVYGPWTIATESQDPALTQGPLAEGSLTVALQYFIEAQKFDEAQKAMAALEKAAGQGEEASAKLTAMYLSMGQSLKERLEQLGSGDKAGSPEVREQAARILAGFEKFLEGIAKRDKKTSSQIWVATTYLMLGSGKGTGAIVAKSKAEQYLDRAAETYGELLKRKDDAGTPEAERTELARFEPSIRLKLVSLFAERGKWEEAQEQMNWILADPKRQNSLDIQIQAAELLQAAGIAAKEAKDDAKADGLLREAAAGRKTPPSVTWGWGGIANKLSRQAFAATDEKSLKSREQFFDARLRVAETFLMRAELPGVAADREKRLETAKNAVVMTRKLYPDLGGEVSKQRFEKVLKQIQKAQGAANPGGFKQVDEEAAAASPPAAAAG